MIRVVIDTSVLVSAVISPTGPNARLSNFIVSKEIRPSEATGVEPCFCRDQRGRVPRTPGRRYRVAPGKKPAEMIQRDVGKEVAKLLAGAFGEWRRTGRIELEALEMLVRDSMHHAGASALR